MTTMTTACAAPVLLRRSEVLRITGLGKSSLHKLVSEGRFPRNVSLLGRTVAWVEAEVFAWCATRIAERDALAA